MKKILLASLLSAFGMISTTASAQVTTSANFQATATVEGACTLSAQNINFGELNVLSNTPVYANGGLTVLCSNGSAYTITPTSTTVFMKNTNNSDMIAISLLKGTSGNDTWQPTQVGGNHGPISGTGNGSNQSYSLRGIYDKDVLVKLYNSQATNNNNYSASFGEYSATMVATVTY